MNQVLLLRKKKSLSGTYNPKDRLYTLCKVVADISAVPWTRKIGKSGRTCFIQRFDVVLLVGRAELEAQIRWIDCRTVRIYW